VRYPALRCFCHEQLSSLVDEVLDRADQAISDAHDRARREFEQRKSEPATAADEKVALFGLLVGLLLDDSITDAELRARAWQAMPPAKWAAAREQARQILRPVDDSYFEQLAGPLHVPAALHAALLAAGRLHGSSSPSPLLDALELLCELNATGRRAPRQRADRLRTRPLARTSSTLTGGSSAAAGRCACCRSCTRRCAPAPCGSRARAATSPPTATSSSRPPGPPAATPLAAYSGCRRAPTSVSSSGPATSSSGSRRSIGCSAAGMAKEPVRRIKKVGDSVTTRPGEGDRRPGGARDRGHAAGEGRGPVDLVEPADVAAPSCLVITRTVVAERHQRDGVVLGPEARARR
jgi:hypothetical protein